MGERVAVLGGGGERGGGGSDVYESVIEDELDIDENVDFGFVV